LKNILFIDTGYEYGGGTKSFLYLLEGLMKCPNEYNFYVFFEHDYLINNDKTINQYLKTLNVTVIENNFYNKKISKIKKELYRLVSKKFLYKKEIQYKIDFAEEVLQSNHYDLIHLNNHFGTNLEYIIGANKLNIPVIQHLRKNSLLTEYQLELLKKLHFRTISVSQSTYKFYNQQLHIDANVIYNPFPIENTKITIENKINSDIVQIFMPANYLENKGHKLVFQALDNVSREDIKVYLAGSGKFDSFTENLKEKLIKQNKLVELGFIQDMDKYYKNSDYVLSFSQNEGLPRTVIEGLMRGCHIITSNYQVSFEIKELLLNQNVYTILPRESQSLEICFMNLKPVTHREIDLNIKEIFSLENYINSVYNYYKQVL
jgi:hypothetical protein